MTASSDPESYGQLTVYVVSNDLPRGPFYVANAIETEPEISRTIANQVAAGGNSSVTFGDLQLVPVADGLLYVRPFYVVRGQAGSQSAGPRYEFITAWYDGRAVIGDTLGEALGELFPGLDLDVGERADLAESPPVDVADEPVTTDPDLLAGDSSPEATAGVTPTDATPAELLAEADRLLSEAEAQLRIDGDLGAYQDRVHEAGVLIDQALAELDAEAGISTEPASSGGDTTVAPTESTLTESPTTVATAPPDHRRVELSPGGYPRGRLSCSASRARSSRNAIW